MSDIAHAVGLSRQSIYNQFGSKEAVLDWTINTFLSNVTEEAVQTLQEAEGLPEKVLSNAFQIWIGNHVPIWRGTPHGAEILELAIDSAGRASTDFEETFSNAVSSFLLSSGLSQNASEAKDMTYVMNLASKGLMLKCQTSEAYTTGMLRVLRTLFP